MCISYKLWWYLYSSTILTSSKYAASYTEVDMKAAMLSLSEAVFEAVVSLSLSLLSKFPIYFKANASSMHDIGTWDAWLDLNVQWNSILNRKKFSNGEVYKENFYLQSTKASIVYKGGLLKSNIFTIMLS